MFSLPLKQPEKGALLSYIIRSNLYIPSKNTDFVQRVFVPFFNLYSSLIHSCLSFQTSQLVLTILAWLLLALLEICPFLVVHSGHNFILILHIQRYIPGTEMFSGL